MKHYSTTRKQTDLKGLIALQIDDFFNCESKTFEINIIEEIKNEFEISKETEKKFSYIGIHIEQNQERLELHQAEYIMKLKEKEVDIKKEKQERLNKE